ncbi:alpha/beta fold hydrolase [Streptomyces sp. NBC_00338]|uniref:alpha/beta fold hydrolase n=1 Tax=Streptomyces sp. NBC_00338 TaxID=2975715 RepID=UPI0022581CC9|nr:alpha/beta fold hydrolase [Streptomyces sp. NBC_00338]MCX5142773.1 alpha/beta fold hydrolase [Streptomyces sp. NBC_00338]
MDQHARGRRAYEGLTGVPAEDALARIREQSPQMYATLVDYAAAGVVTHAELGWAERELVTVAVLAALGGAEGQLATHTRAALHQGHAASELLALCEHVALYAGLPRALNALAVVDEVLTASGLPGPAALRTVRLGDHDTVVARRGDEGPPVLLVHSLGVDWRMWEPVMERLAAGRRVFAYDIRGHGAAAGAPAATGMSGLGTDLVAVLDALELERAHLVGLSVGGAIGQTAAVLHPGRIASLALLGAPDHPVPEAFESRARAAETEGMDAQIAPTLTRWFTPEALAENTWGVRYARERVRRFDPADWAATWRAYKTLDVRDRLRDLQAPTLVVAGELDAAAPPAFMSGVAGRIPGSVYRELPRAPHMQTLEQPGPLADILDAFLPAG